MKTKYLFLSLVFAAFLSSSIPVGSHALEIGKEAPSLTLTRKSSIDNFDALKDKYVVVNFWSTTDAQSRIDNRRLSELSQTLPSSQIAFVSICTDPDSSLNKEITRIDGISPSVISLSASDVTPEVLKDFQTSTGCRSFVIDPFGNLQAISPTPSSIASLLS